MLRLQWCPWVLRKGASSSHAWICHGPITPPRFVPSHGEGRLHISMTVDDERSEQRKGSQSRSSTGAFHSLDTMDGPRRKQGK